MRGHWVELLPSCKTLFRNASSNSTLISSFNDDQNTDDDGEHSYFFYFLTSAVITVFFIVAVLAIKLRYNLRSMVKQRAANVGQLCVICLLLGCVAFPAQPVTNHNAGSSIAQKTHFSPSSSDENSPFPPNLPFLRKDLSNFPSSRHDAAAFLQDVPRRRIQTMLKQYKCVYRTLFGVEGINVLQVVGPILRRLVQETRGSTLLLDIGSNTGQEFQTLLDLLLKQQHTDKKNSFNRFRTHVVSVEPNPEYRSGLTRIAERVLKRDKSEMIVPTLCQAAVANELVQTASELFMVGKGVLANIVTKEELQKLGPGAGSSIPVEQLRISQLVKLMKTRRTVLVKIDTEGLDWTIMWSLMSLWSQIRPDIFIFEVNPFLERFPSHPSLIHESFQSMGYSMYVVGMYYDGEDRRRAKPTLAEEWGDSRLPLMFLLEMSKERWYASTPAFGWSEAGLALPNEGEVLQEFIPITSDSPASHQRLIKHILQTKVSRWCSVMSNVDDWRVLVHKGGWENRTSSAKRMTRIFSQSQL